MPADESGSGVGTVRQIQVPFGEEIVEAVLLHSNHDCMESVSLFFAHPSVFFSREALQAFAARQDARTVAYVETAVEVWTETPEVHTAVGFLVL